MRRFKKFLATLFVLAALTGASAGVAHAADSAEWASLQGRELHIKLIETALRYDSYNKRCRGISVSKEVNLVNRLFLRKYGMTVHNFIKQQMQTDPRDYQETVKQTLYKELAEMGGCEGSKEQGMITQFQNDFRVLFERAENANWFPE